MHTQSEENYLKAIFAISANGNASVSTNALAERLQTQASSVTDMIKKLSEKALVEYQPYQGVRLSETGMQSALQVIRKHRLWETFLVEKLNFGWDEVHDMAEQLEHVQAPELTERLNSFLDYPTHDPHGDPIPNAEGQIEPRKAPTLDHLKVGETAVVVGVLDSSTEFLKYLNTENIGLGAHLEVLNIVSFDRSMSLRLDGGSTLSVSHSVTKNLFVKRV